MWIAPFNLGFAHSLGALVYLDEKVASIVITQSIKCILQERNSRSIIKTQLLYVQTSDSLDATVKLFTTWVAKVEHNQLLRPTSD